MRVQFPGVYPGNGNRWLRSPATGAIDALGFACVCACYCDAPLGRLERTAWRSPRALRMTPLESSDLRLHHVAVLSSSAVGEGVRKTSSAKEEVWE